MKFCVAIIVATTFSWCGWENKKVTLAWDPSPQAVSYRVYEHVGDKYRFVGSSIQPRLTFWIRSGNPHRFVIQAVGATPDKQSGYSNEVILK